MRATEGDQEEAEKEVQPSIVQQQKQIMLKQLKSTQVDNHKAQKGVWSKISRNHIDWKENAEAEAAYKKQVEDYKTQQAAYDKALEEYNAKRLFYDAKVAEKQQQMGQCRSKS